MVHYAIFGMSAQIKEQPLALFVLEVTHSLQPMLGTIVSGARTPKPIRDLLLGRNSEIILALAAFFPGLASNLWQG
jgi:hypothetical protein